MDDLASRLEQTRDRFSELSDDAVERVMARAERRGVARKRRMRATVATCVLLLVATAGIVFRHREDITKLPDGSRITRLAPASAFTVSRVTAAGIDVILHRGRARFDIVKNPERLFRVYAGHVIIEVMGTRFVVEVRTGEVIVEVESGTVRVIAPEGESVITKGDRMTFAPVVDAKKDTPEEPEMRPPVLPDPAPAMKDPPRPTVVPRWRTTAANGNYEKAYSEMRSAGEHAVRDVPEELLLAADVARWSQHPDAAVPYLKRVVSEHRRDPRAQLAAFTLGRVYLEELGQPAQAAQVFAKARTLKPDGALAEDALAREVEAWSRAGNRAHATESAEAYMRLYPDGPHAQMVRRFGEL